jgi:hypothetical protein
MSSSLLNRHVKRRGRLNIFYSKHGSRLCALQHTAFFSLLLRFVLCFSLLRFVSIFHVAQKANKTDREYNVREICVSELLMLMSYAKWYKNYFIIGKMAKNEEDLKHFFPCISVS